MHFWLLKKISTNSTDEDAFLASLMEPLADASDELTDEEIEKLPLQLQYYEGKRESDLTIICKLIETLYQVCNNF